MRSTFLTISPFVISCHLLRLDDPRTIWVIWWLRAYSTIASAGSSAASVVPLGAEIAGESAKGVDRRRGWTAETTASPVTWTTCSSVLRRAARRAARRQRASVPGAPVTQTRIRSVVSQMSVTS